jgi:uncharacterized membrane protein (UPF0127 family)
MKKFRYGFFLLFIAAACGADERLPLSAFPQSTLQIATPDARIHRFKIWVAEDDTRRSQGLMFVKDLPAGSGMLFVYSQPHRIAMWMKNTLIPLDMLFIRADGRVGRIAANTVPLSLDNIESCDAPPKAYSLPPEQAMHCADPKDDVIAVLELKGGVAASLNIRAGAVVMHPFFSTGAK